MKTSTQDKRATLSLFRRGVRLLKTYMPRFFASILLHGTVEALAVYIRVMVFAEFLQRLTQAEDARELWIWGGIVALTTTVLMITEGLLRRWKESKWECLYRTCDRIVTDRCLEMDHATLSDEAVRASLAKVRENTAALGKGLVQIPEAFQDLWIGAVGTLGALLTLGHRMALPRLSGTYAGWLPVWICAAGAVLAGILAVSQKLTEASARGRRRVVDRVVALDRLYYTMMDRMFDSSNAAQSRLYRQDRTVELYLKQTDKAFFAPDGIKRYSRSMAGAAGAAGVTALWLGAVYAAAVAAARAGLFGVAATVQIIGSLAALMQHVRRGCHGVASLRNSLPFLETTFAFLGTKPQMYRGSLTTEKRRDGEYEWEFRHVTFCYPGQTEAALRDVSVVLHAGARVAVVGENGSGKSTFLKLLCRLYDPDEGEILLNGIDIRKYNEREYTDLVAAVFQDGHLFLGPLGNAVSADVTYDAAAVGECLETAGAPRLQAELEHGFETPVHLGGTTPMAGEETVQAVAVARALYKQAPLLLLDEPTASLDPTAQAAFCERFDRIAEHHTTVCVSHRPTIWRRCRQILVFEHGRIAECGTHQELVALPNGAYRALWEAGTQYYQ